MQKKRRRGRTSTKTSVEDEIAHLRGLDLGGLRARWQSVFQRSAPVHLTRQLLFAVIAYRLQADRWFVREQASAIGGVSNWSSPRSDFGRPRQGRLGLGLLTNPSYRM